MQARPLPCSLMADKKPEPTQKTQPRGINPKTDKPYKPIEIPVPKRGYIDKLLARATKGSTKKG